MIEITNYKIRKTSDYDLFKTLKGNRDVVDRRKDKIKKSISEIGYLLNPIIVNEKMEIVDGQGRFKALSELGMPIYYVIQEGIGLEQCRYLNRYNEKWTMTDYIKSYSKIIPDYMRLEEIVSNNEDFSLSEIVTAIYNGFGYCNGGYSEQIRNGSIKVSEAQSQNAKLCLGYTRNFFPYIKFRSGNKQNTNLSKIIMFCFYHPDVDNNLLYHQFEKYPDKVENSSNQKEALICIETLYNHRARKREDIHLTSLYKRAKKQEPVQYTYSS